MNALIAQFREKLSPTAAYGLVVLAFLFGLMAVDPVHQRVVQAKTDSEFAARELAKLNTIENTDLWSQRAEASGAALQQWQSVKWDGETVGVLAAKIQQELIQIAQDIGLRNPQISVGNELIEVDGETIMRFSLAGAASDNTAPIELLLKTSDLQKSMVFTEVTADFFQGRSLIRLSGLALVQVAGRAGGTEPANRPGAAQ